MTIRSACLSLLAPVLLASSARAEERYFVTLFASQVEPNLPRFAHTFAVFSKATGDPDSPKDAKVESHTMSWLPASLEVRPLKLVPEKGKNLELAATLQWAKSHKARVTAWGPYEIRKELFDAAIARIADLNGGKFSFLAIDSPFRGQGAVNCIHAVSDIAPNGAQLATGTARGDAATRLIVQHFHQWMVQPQVVHPWVADRFGIAREEVRWEGPVAAK